MTSPVVGEAFVRPSSFAVELGVSKRTIERWIRARVIPSIKIGRLVLIDPAKARAALGRFETRSVELPVARIRSFNKQTAKKGVKR